MKKLSSLIVTLVLGSSAAALAAPSYVAPQEPADRHELLDRDMRRPGEWQRPSSWLMLGGGRLSYYNGRTSVDVSSLARFQKLQLTARRGTLDIKRVTITFANGEHQTVRLNKRVDAACPVTIDLDGRMPRQIAKITVSGSAESWRGSFSLLAV